MDLVIITFPGRPVRLPAALLPPSDPPCCAAAEDPTLDKVERLLEPFNIALDTSERADASSHMDGVQGWELDRICGN